MNHKFLLALGLLSFFVLLSYNNCLDNEFIWDDEFLIQKNTYLRSFSHLPKMLVSNSTAGFGGQDSFYRPTQNIYYLLIYQMFGESKIAFHLGNILLHLLNTLLLFFLTLNLFGRWPVAFLCALFWTTHPTHVEAITYISGTADPMATLFFLIASLVFPFKKPMQNLKKYGLSLVFVSLAIVSKEALIIAPALLSLIFAYKNNFSFKARLYTPLVPHWIIAFLYLLLRKTWLNFGESFQFYKTSNIYTENILYRCYTYLATLPEYLKILLTTTDFHMERSFPVHTQWFDSPVLLGFFLFFGSLFAALVLSIKKKQHIALFCWLWFFGSFVPMNGIIIPANSFILEHWLYLSSMSIFMLLGHIFTQIFTKQKNVATIIAVILVTLFSTKTIMRNEDWKTPIRFYTNILQYNSGTARIHNNLAMAYSEKKEWNSAIHHYKIAIEKSDSYSQTHHNLARAYIQLNRFDEALEHLNRSLEINPQFDHSIRLKQSLLQFINKKQGVTNQ